jgi:hypothetical protein
MMLAVPLACLLACSRPQPSPEYEQARALWTTVMQERGTDAGDDPRAQAVSAPIRRLRATGLHTSRLRISRGLLKSSEQMRGVWVCRPSSEHFSKPRLN